MNYRQPVIHENAPGESLCNSFVCHTSMRSVGLVVEPEGRCVASGTWHVAGGIMWPWGKQRSIEWWERTDGSRTHQHQHLVPQEAAFCEKMRWMDGMCRTFPSWITTHLPGAWCCWPTCWDLPFCSAYGVPDRLTYLWSFPNNQQGRGNEEEIIFLHFSSAQGEVLGVIFHFYILYWYRNAFPLQSHLPRTSCCLGGWEKEESKFFKSQKAGL